MSAQRNRGKNYKFVSDEKEKADSKGTKPLPAPYSISDVFTDLFIKICRRVIFLKIYYRVAFYLLLTFLSVVCDFAPLPRNNYFSQSSNFFNQYFVKLGWFWTLICSVPFVFCTSFTYCCGNRRLVSLHLARLGIATAVWYIFTTLFQFFENNTGRCVGLGGEKFGTKKLCLTNGLFWQSWDISGHAFILIYSTLVLIEEAKAFDGWCSIKDLIRNEDHNRNNKITDLSSPLKGVTEEDYKVLKLGYTTFGPYIRVLFVLITFLTCLWDVMLIATALYFHKMVEKLFAALLAVAVWFITYRVWYSSSKFPPNLPGQGMFIYYKPKPEPSVGVQRNGKASRARSGDSNSFMGMPLNTNKNNSPAESTIRTRPFTRSQNVSLNSA